MNAIFGGLRQFYLGKKETLDTFEPPRIKEVQERDTKNGIILTESVRRQQMNEDVLDKTEQKGNLTVPQKQTPGSAFMPTECYYCLRGYSQQLFHM